jgi:hypothetical protein
MTERQFNLAKDLSDKLSQYRKRLASLDSSERITIIIHSDDMVHTFTGEHPYFSVELIENYKAFLKDLIEKLEQEFSEI